MLVLEKKTYEGETVELLIDPDRLQRNVISNAMVVYSDELQFSDEMRYLNDSKYNCFGGAVRLYLPIDINEEEDSNKHRYITGKYIEEKGEAFILNIFRRALAQDVHYYDKMFRLEDCRRIKKEAEQNRNLEKVETLYINESDERKSKEYIIQKMEEEIEQLKSDNYNLNKQNEILQERGRKLQSAESANQKTRDIKEYPNTPMKIADYFSRVFSDRMVFSERGWKSLEECQTKSDILWEIFYDMATILYPLLHENPVLAYTKFSQKTKWDCARCEGKMTRNDSKLMRQYDDEYNGDQINIEAHVKNGNKESDNKFVRIYFAYNPMVCDKIIIGHCGKHLKNYTSQKSK